jgi:hypothetical protein
VEESLRKVRSDFFPPKKGKNSNHEHKSLSNSPTHHTMGRKREKHWGSKKEKPVRTKPVTVERIQELSAKEDELDAKFGFHTFKDGAEKLGWLINMKAVISKRIFVFLSSLSFFFFLFRLCCFSV